MTAKSMRLAELPLLGSNQDSPDPESAASAALGATADRNGVGLAQIPAESHTIPHTKSHPRSHCRRGHAMTPENTIAHEGRAHACRTCVRLRQRAKNEGLTVAEFRVRQPPVRQLNTALRRDEANGVPCTVRCDACGNVFTDTLGDLNPCPHCGKIARGAAA